MKCSHIFRLADGTESSDTELFEVNGEKLVSVDVFKDPVTDPGKASKAGRLDLAFIDTGNTSDHYVTVALFEDEINHKRSVMHTVYENGELMNETTFEEVRAKVKSDSAVTFGK